MAAPNSAYRIGTLPINIGATVLGQVLWALVESGVSDTVIKNRFYLDGFFSIGDGAAGNITVNNGFAGFCYVGSDNYYMHNLSRISYVTAWHEGRDMVIFNDAGLNTLGEAWVSTLETTFEGLRAIVVGKSAYYINTDRIGISFRKQGNPTWTDSDDAKFIAQNDLDTYLFYNLRTETVGSEWVTGDIIEFRGYNINNEGKSPYSPIQNITIPRPSVILYTGNARWPSETPAYTESSRTTFYAEGFGDYTTLTLGPTGPPYIIAGFYRNESTWFRYELLSGGQPGETHLTEVGALGEWPSYDPAYDDPNFRAETSFVHYTTSATNYSAGCLTVQGGDMKNPQSIWLANDGIYYNAQTGTTKAGTGMYYAGDAGSPLASIAIMRLRNMGDGSQVLTWGDCEVGFPL